MAAKPFTEHPDSVLRLYRALGPEEFWGLFDWAKVDKSYPADTWWIKVNSGQDHRPILEFLTKWGFEPHPTQTTGRGVSFLCQEIGKP